MKVKECCSGVNLCIREEAEAPRKTRTVVQGPELAFRMWIVIGDLWPGMRFVHAKISQRQSHRFRFHRTPVIDVQGELAWRDLLRMAGVFDQALG